MTAIRPDGETQVLASVRNAARLLREFGRGKLLLAFPPPDELDRRLAGPVQRVNGDNLRRFARPVTDAAAQISHRLAGGFAAPGEAEPGEAEPREAI